MKKQKMSFRAKISRLIVGLIIVIFAEQIANFILPPSGYSYPAGSSMAVTLATLNKIIHWIQGIAIVVGILMIIKTGWNYYSFRRSSLAK